MLRLKSDLLPALLATADGVLKTFDLRWHDDAALTVVMAANGYPGDYAKGTPIRGLDAAPRRGGRRGLPRRHARARAAACSPPAAACSTSRRAARPSARRSSAAYAAVARIDWPGGFCRSDIGWRAIAREKEQLMSALPDLFPGFAERRIKTGRRRDLPAHRRRGPPLLLLHGYPQTHVCWHKIAPELARHCTLVIADLRGYGASSAPPGDAEHMTYSKRAMAEDCLAVMRALGHERFMVAGHDRGGRVAYRLALDHPEAVQALVPIDIMPTAEVWRRANADGAVRSYHWAFLAQPQPLPETLIGSRPRLLPRAHAEELGQAARPVAVLAPRRSRTTARCCRTRPACMRSARTTAPAPPSIGSLDEADLAAGRKIACPTFVLWASALPRPRRRRPLDVWRGWCTNVERRRGRLRPFPGRGEPARTRWPPCCRSCSPTRRPQECHPDRHGRRASHDRVPTGQSADSQGAHHDQQAPSASRSCRRVRIALALGGGGARGLAHILMLEVFDELGLKPKIIAGTSIGAMFGAAYASGLSARLIRAHAEEMLGQRFDIARQLLSARSEPILKFLNFLPDALGAAEARAAARPAAALQGRPRFRAAANPAQDGGDRLLRPGAGGARPGRCAARSPPAWRCRPSSPRSTHRRPGADGRRPRQSAALRCPARGGRHHGRHRRQRRLDRARQASPAIRFRGADRRPRRSCSARSCARSSRRSSPTSTSTSRSMSSMCWTFIASSAILAAAVPAKEQSAAPAATRAGQPDRRNAAGRRA